MSGRRWAYPDMNTTPLESTETLCNEICQRFGYQEVRRWQALAIQAVLSGNDVVVSSGTGSGKSLAYQALALSKPNAIVLVISPLLSIMEDQVKKLSDTHLIIGEEAKYIENPRGCDNEKIQKGESQNLG